MDLVTFALVFSAALILARIGWRPGNFGVYFHQLVTPFLVIVVFRALSTARLPRAVLIALPCVQLLAAFAEFQPLPREDPRQWRNWEALFAEHQEVYAAPVFAHILAKQGKAIYDAGQAQYVQYGLKGPLPGIAQQIRARLTEYRNELHDKIARGDFTLIVLWQGEYHDGVSRELMAEHYELVELRECPCTLSQIRYEIWVRTVSPAPLETLPREGLALWLRAETGVRTAPDGRVQAWSDQSDHGHEAVPRAPEQQPQHISATETSHAALRFDGLDDTLVIGSLTGRRPRLTLLLMLKPAGLPAHGHSVGAIGGWRQFWFHSNERGGIYVQSGTGTRIAPDDGPGPGTLVLGEWQLFTYVTDGNSASLYGNGVLLARKPAGRGAPWDGFQLGHPQAVRALAGDVGEVVLYDRALPDDERRAVEEYLRNDFGIAHAGQLKQ
jgi:hypothetical protein